LKTRALLVADRILAFTAIVGRENVIAGTDCGLGGRVHPQIAWAKLRALRDGAALASNKFVELNSRAREHDERKQKQELKKPGRAEL